MIYDIAGLRMAIDNRLNFTARFCENYISDDQTSPVDLRAAVTDEEFYAEKAVANGNFSDGYIENICMYRKICKQLPVFNRMLLHASVLAYGNAGYAFLGRSGTGKSTHTGLWLKHIPSTKIVNGDKPILSYIDGEFTAYGTPWMGKEGLGENTSVPLKGLCFLEQAKQNAIRRLSVQEAAKRVFLQVLIPEEEENAKRTLELIDKLIATVPCYVLQCDISETAVQTSFEMLTGKLYSQK